MFMFYKIGNDYYVLVGNRYMQVEFKVNGEELNAVPTGKSVERTNEVHAIEQPFNEEFKKQFTRKREPERDGMKERSRFGRDR